MENLKRHILSDYAAKDVVESDFLNLAWAREDKCNTRDAKNIAGPTIITKTVENSDPDEFMLGDPTYLTHAIEESDPDEFRMDNIPVYSRFDALLEPTRHTYTVETTDEDEFIFM